MSYHEKGCFMPSYQNYNNTIITKELLNKNRVLTMSNNRKCNYLIVDVGRDSTTMMAINTQGNTKDILVIKTLYNKLISELVEEAYWLCNEFGIQIVLVDCMSIGLGFIEEFEMNINPNNATIRALDGRKVYQLENINKIQNDLKYGALRFLQSPELATTSYMKPFLGLSNIMNSHKETDKLINEVNNINTKVNLNGTARLCRINENIGRSRVNCLLTFYSYPMSVVIPDQEESKDNNKEFEIAKRMSQYEIVHGTFYKYMFKCIENNGINVLFYYNGKHKILQFQNIVKEKQFNTLFSNNIKSIKMSKNDLEIIFHNNSSIKFVFANDSARGYRCHYAIVDNEIERETFENVIYSKTILFDMAKKEEKIKDIYNIDYIEM